MIYMRIWEGLGNQMFQYAYIRALQLRHNVDVCLCSIPASSARSTPRQYELDNLRIELKRNVWFEKIGTTIEKRELLKQILQNTADKWQWPVYIKENNLQYNSIYMHLGGTCYVNGWFQNENYFKDYEETIRKELRPKNKIQISYQLKYMLSEYNTISIHIRRGDFKKHNNLVPAEYYQNAIKVMNSRFPDVFYIVFSDDPQWVARYIDLGRNFYFVANEKGLRDYEEIFIMSKCKHNIISNSTFSWWGAWLNNNKDKIVIGPKRWFVNSNINIMPENWIKL